MPSTPRVLGAIAALSLVLAACSSGASIQTSSPPPASGGGSVAPSLAPSAAPSSVASAAPPAASPGASSGSSSGPLDLPGTAANLEQLDAYKVILTFEGGEQPGTGTLITVRKPVLARSFDGDFGGTPTKVIIIGDDVWMDSGAGVWVKNAIPAVAAAALFGAFDPVATMLGIGAWADAGALQQVGSEEKNGVQAVHYHLNSSTVPAAASFPPDMVVDLWVAAEGGYVVSVRTSGMPADGGPTAVTMDVSNVNDPSLTIAPPS